MQPDVKQILGPYMIFDKFQNLLYPLIKSKFGMTYKFFDIMFTPVTKLSRHVT